MRVSKSELVEVGMHASELPCTVGQRYRQMLTVVGRGAGYCLGAMTTLPQRRAWVTISRRMNERHYDLLAEGEEAAVGGGRQPTKKHESREGGSESPRSRKEEKTITLHYLVQVSDLKQ